MYMYYFSTDTCLVIQYIHNFFCTLDACDIPLTLFFGSHACKKKHSSS